MEPALDLERFAALSAELESGASKDELCAREGISVEALTSAQELWLGKMAEEVRRHQDPPVRVESQADQAGSLTST